MLKLASVNVRMTVADALALEAITRQNQAKNISETIRQLIQAEAKRRDLATTTPPDNRTEQSGV